MWLPKDQRILLSYYYSQGRPGHICQRDPNTLIKELRERKEQKKKEIVKSKQVDEKYVMDVLRSLQKHGLIRDVKKVRDTGQIEVKLTQEAIKLGRKCDSKIGTLGVWFTEYLWFWVILGVIISFVGLLVAILKD